MVVLGRDGGHIAIALNHLAEVIDAVIWLSLVRVEFSNALRREYKRG